MSDRNATEIDILYEILGDTADTTGEEYFDRLVESVTSALDAGEGTEKERRCTISPRNR